MSNSIIIRWVFRLKACFIGMITFCYCLSVFSADPKIIGPVYVIAETDFIQMARQKIQTKISREGESGWQIQQKSIRVSADRPAPALGWRPTIHARRWLFDPSFVIPSDVRTANNSMLLKAGSRFNPLEKVRLKNTLIFFNGDDPEQLAWAHAQNKALSDQVVLILVKGSLQTVSAQFPHKKVYFDQGGLMIQKLGITQMPALVTQNKDQLEIQEVKP